MAEKTPKEVTPAAAKEGDESAASPWSREASPAATTKRPSGFLKLRTPRRTRRSAADAPSSSGSSCGPATPPPHPPPPPSKAEDKNAVKNLAQNPVAATAAATAATAAAVAATTPSDAGEKVDRLSSSLRTTSLRRRGKRISALDSLANVLQELPSAEKNKKQVWQESENARERER